MTTQTSSSVIQAVDTAISALPKSIQDVLLLRPIPAGVYQAEDGDWVVPVGTGSSPAMEKSYQLHRVLSELQNQVEQQLNTFVTLTLEH